MRFYGFRLMRHGPRSNWFQCVVPMSHMATLLLLALSSRAIALVTAWRPPPVSAHKPGGHRHRSVRCQEGSYDLGRKSFDLLELQEFRRETLLQYDLLNRVELLRIILFGLSAAVSAVSPTIAKELFLVDPSGDQGYLTAAAGTFFFGGLALQSKVSRGRKLRRLENEFAASELGVCQPRSAVLGNSQRSSTLAQLRGRRRVLAFYGPPDVLRAAVAAAEVYRTRWQQSAVVVVAVVCGGQEVRTTVPYPTADAPALPLAAHAQLTHSSRTARRRGVQPGRRRQPPPKPGVGSTSRPMRLRGRVTLRVCLPRGRMRELMRLLPQRCGARGSPSRCR